MFVLIWFGAIVLNLHLMISTALINGKCVVAYKLLRTFWVDVQSYYAIVVSFGIPITVILFCYVHMFAALIESLKKFHSGNSQSSSTDKLRLAHMNIFKTCVIIVIVYLAAWITIESSIFLYLIGYYEILGLHNQIGAISVTFNSCVNPFIYAMKYEDFKIRFKSLIIIKPRLK